MLSQLKDLIPGAAHWPRFVRNESEQFEARLVSVEVLPSPSIWLRGMHGARLPVPVAHGEGRVRFDRPEDALAVETAQLAALRFVDPRGAPTTRYPWNPNGSADGLAALTSADGRATIMMPHPERAFRALQLSYRPEGLFAGEAGPWMRMFRNARAWCAQRAAGQGGKQA